LGKSGEQRILAWVNHRILEPRFDDPYAQMPKPDVTEAEARVITEYLLVQFFFN
jgi:hypothetical protein